MDANRACARVPSPCAGGPRVAAGRVARPGRRDRCAADHAASLQKLIAAHNVVIVDTRVLEAFEQSHIKDALPLPLEGRLTWPDSYEKTVAILLKTKKPVVAYCA